MYNKIRFQDECNFIEPQDHFSDINIEESGDDTRVLDSLLITYVHDRNRLINLIKTKSSPSHKLFLVESYAEKHIPWILNNMEYVWDSFKLHKYEYDDNGECRCIFKSNNKNRGRQEYEIKLYKDYIMSLKR